MLVPFLVPFIHLTAVPIAILTFKCIAMVFLSQSIPQINKSPLAIIFNQTQRVINPLDVRLDYPTLGSY